MKKKVIESIELKLFDAIENVNKGIKYDWKLYNKYEIQKCFLFQ